MAELRFPECGEFYLEDPGVSDWWQTEASGEKDVGSGFEHRVVRFWRDQIDPGKTPRRLHENYDRRLTGIINGVPNTAVHWALQDYRYKDILLRRTVEMLARRSLDDRLDNNDLQSVLVELREVYDKHFEGNSFTPAAVLRSALALFVCDPSLSTGVDFDLTEEELAPLGNPLPSSLLTFMAESTPAKEGTLRYSAGETREWEGERLKQIDTDQPLGRISPEEVRLADESGLRAMLSLLEKIEIQAPAKAAKFRASLSADTLKRLEAALPSEPKPLPPGPTFAERWEALSPGERLRLRLLFLEAIRSGGAACK